MSGRRYHHPPESELDGFDIAIEWLLGVLLVFSPLAFGATEAWSQVIAYGLVAVITLGFALKLVVRGSEPIAWTWTYVPIVLVIALAFAQLIPWSAGVANTLSPHTVQLRSSLLGDWGPEPINTISLYPLATRRMLRLLIAASAVFVVVANVYRTGRQVRRLLLTIACVGLAVAMLAAYQNLTGTDMVYGIVPMVHRNAGPFMNYSHFSQFTNLSTGAALGLLCVTIARESKIVGDEPERIIQRLRQMWSAWVCIALCVLGPITVFLSMSRMGMISCMVAGALVAALLIAQSRGKGHGSPVLALGLLVLVGLLCVGFDAVYARLATLRHIEHADNGRLQMLHDLLVVFRTFPWVGTGLGTHEFVFPMFNHATFRMIATHAENEYAQLTEEMGFPALALMFAFVAIVARAGIMTVRRSIRSIRFAVYGLAFGLIAVAVHSFTDFGQHVPAVAFVSATACGLLISLHRQTQAEVRAATAEASQPASPLPVAPHPIFALIRLAGGLGAAALFAWVLIPAIADQRAAAAWLDAWSSSTDLAAVGWKGSDDTYVTLLRQATAAATLVPTDVTYQYWLNVYRWRSIERGAASEQRGILFDAKGVAFVHKLVDQFRQAALLCPTFGPPYAVGGQLERSVLNDARGIHRVATGFGLTPYDETVCLAEASMATAEHHWSDAMAAFERLKAMGDNGRTAVAKLTLQGHRPDLAYQIAAGDRLSLNYLAELLAGNYDSHALAERCRAESLDLLRAQAQQPSAEGAVLVELANDDASGGDLLAAVGLYRRALETNYDRTDWRLQLATLLARIGQRPEAMQQARTCLRLRPEMKDAETLLGNLSIGAVAGSPQ